jgi:uncharacterized membrane protein YjjP (DUF1212 family)
LGKLLDAHRIYWRVIHDQLGVGEASQQLDELMKKRVRHSPLLLLFHFVEGADDVI